MPDGPEVAGRAALSMCESLLLALNDRNILSEHQIVKVMQDAAVAQTNDASRDDKGDLHRAAAALINGILAGGNSVRRR